jgi:hypothetical protein
MSRQIINVHWHPKMLLAGYSRAKCCVFFGAVVAWKSSRDCRRRRKEIPGIETYAYGHDGLCGKRRKHMSQLQTWWLVWFFCTKSQAQCTGCVKKSSAMVFEMLLWGECYENVYTRRRTNYPSFKMFKYKRFRNTLQTATFGIAL